MQSSIFLCLLAASVAFAAPAAEINAQPSGGSPSSGGCPGGYSEGAEVERGRLVYTCSGGNLVAKACITQQLTRINVGENFDLNQNRYKCSAGSYDFVGCVKNSKEIKVGDTVDDGTAFYSCDSAGEGGKLVNQGCLDGGKRVKKGEKVTKEDGIYTCEAQPNDGAKLVVSGCGKGGKTYNEGDTFDDGKIYFKCTRTGREKYVAKPTGCVVQGKRLNDGDSYNEGGVFYECRIDNDQLTTVATGCESKEGGSIQRKLGCTFNEGPIEYQCKQEGNKAVKVPIRCNYNVGGGIYNIEPGTYRAVDKGFQGCSQDGGSLKLQAYADEKAAQGAGLKSS